MEKNILYICDYAANYTGSFIAAMAQLARQAGEDNQIYFLFPEAAREKRWLTLLPVDRSHIFYSDFSVKNLAAACKALSKQLGPANTVVHTHFVGDLRLLAVRTAFSRIICHYHMMVPKGTTLSKKLKQLVRKIIYRGLILVGVSEAVTADCRAYFWKVRCECVPNAIDFEMLETCSPEPLELPRKHDGEFRILIHGSDFVCKGVDVAIRAMELLEAEYPGQFRLYMTSNTVDQTWDNIRQLTDRTEAITVLRSVENIKSLYDAVDLYASPSREEAFSYAVVEASYSGCQVAASDIPGQNTMKPVPGILWFGKDDPEGMKEAILKAREDLAAGRTPGIKEAQKAYVARNFRISQWVDRNLMVYKKYFG